MAVRQDGGTGNGDTCPIDPAHGHMFVLNSANGTQWCGHSDHESAKGKDGAPDRPKTKAMWPTGHESFAAAVAKYREEHPNA